MSKENVAKRINEVEFDTPFRLDKDGNVIQVGGLYAPEVTTDEDAHPVNVLTKKEEAQGKCWRHDYGHREYVCTCDPPVEGDTGREEETRNWTSR